MVLTKRNENLRPLSNPSITRYTVPDTQVEFWVFDRDLPGQYFNIVLPTGVSYADSLPIYSSVAQLERPLTDKPIIVKSLTRRKEDESCEEFPFPLDTPYDIIRQQVPGQFIAVGIRYRNEKLKSGKEFWRSATAHFSFSSSERRLPPYLVDIALRFSPEMPKQKLEDAFKQFEQELLTH
ncbi:MAG: hypothetical protein HYW23_00755 [Candidatus Aenigmarchaeota archaeon]|nr:hypothetical protein [Candidatus Aenigmarchaeota archaeon]